MIKDFPLLRQCKKCPFCSNAKILGSVVCWDCWRAHDMRHGDGMIVKQHGTATVKEVLTKAETSLAKGAA